MNQEENNFELAFSMFSSSSVEDEGWFPGDIYVDPEGFSPGNHKGSSIIFADSGGGKTATIQKWKAIAQEEKVLCVDWRLALYEGKASSAIADQHLRDVLKSIARELLSRVLDQLDIFSKLPKSIQRFFLAYFNVMSSGEVMNILDDTIGVLEDVQIDFLKQIDGYTFGQYDTLTEKTSIEDIRKKLVQQISYLGYSGFWIFIDWIPLYEGADFEQFYENINAIFRFKPTFQAVRFAYKVALPVDYKPDLEKAGSLETGRCTHNTLSWSSEKYQRLVSLIEKRLQVGFDDPEMTLGAIYSETKFKKWLILCGGDTPRGWLELARPIVYKYILKRQAGENKKLSKEEWKAAQRVSSVTIGYDSDRSVVRVGFTKHHMSPQNLALFDYLYKKSVEQEGIPISREELYYKILLPNYLGVQEAQPVDEETKEFPKEYDDMVSQALYRLRKVIEPDLKNPIFIHTKRGRGIYLTRKAEFD